MLSIWTYLPLMRLYPRGRHGVSLVGEKSSRVAREVLTVLRDVGNDVRCTVCKMICERSRRTVCLSAHKAG